jgi:hypothetical protein
MEAKPEVAAMVLRTLRGRPLVRDADLIGGGARGPARDSFASGATAPGASAATHCRCRLNEEMTMDKPDDRQTHRARVLAALFAAVALSAACGGGGGGNAPAPAPAPSPGTTSVYIGYYVEDAVNNPEDPTVGAMFAQLPNGDASFAGQMPFSYVGCSTGTDIGTISGTRSGLALNGSWTGTLDGVAVGGTYSGSYDAANDRYSGTYANSAGKQPIASGPCNYFVAAQGTWRLFGGPASEPAGFALSATDSTSPTLSWSGAGSGLAYTIRVFDYDCLSADITNTACFRGEASTTLTSIGYPSGFAGATPLTVGVNYLLVVTAQNQPSGTYAAFASRLFTPATTASAGGGSGGGTVGTTCGTLTVSGTGSAAFSGSIVTGADGNGISVFPASVPPTCSGSAQFPSCTSSMLLSWIEFDSNYLQQEGITVSFNSTTNAAPGNPAGTGINGMTLGVVRPDSGASFALICASGFPCADLASAGVTLDQVARTVTFSNTTLDSTTVTASSITLDGTLSY